MKASIFKKTALSATLGLALISTANAKGLTDRIIIKYKQGVNVSETFQARGMEILSKRVSEKISHAKFMHDGSQVIKLANKKSKLELQRLMRKIATDPNIEYVEEDRILQKSATANDTYYSLQWHYNDATAGIDLETAWDTSTGSGVTVAVLDTGYTNHSDLNTNLTGGYDMISDAFVGNDGNSGRDSDASDPGDWITTNECGYAHSSQSSSWHGTHVAGTIAAVTNNNKGVAGIAYDAVVVPVRVLGKCGGYTSDIADGIVWAAGGSVSGVPSNPNPASVINMSLGGGGSCDNTSQNAINTARSLGSVVIVAAGNENQNVSNSSPANCNGVVAVAATNKQSDRASYSNYGNLVDLAGPGGEAGQEGVASLLNDGSTVPGSETYVYYSGTSMATPHVAGVAALMYSVDPSLTPDEVENTLKSTSRSFPNGSSCSTNTCGDGMLDAAAAVAAVNGGGNPPQNQAPNASFSFSCNDLTCSFDGSGSSDSDGSISSYSWSFGASGSTANNTFGSAGTYSVTLTVTDNEGATDNQTKSVTVTEPSSSSITMTIGENRRGNKIQVYWSGASGSKVDIYKNGSRVSRTRNDGAWNDKNVSSGVTYTYQVCEQGSTSQCSASGNYTL